MAKLAITSEVMIQVSFLVMNLEHLLVRVGSFVCVAWGPSCRSAWNGLLLARWLKLKTNFRGRRGCGIEARGVSGPQLLARF
jgi:hypothetical protein